MTDVIIIYIVIIAQSFCIFSRTIKTFLALLNSWEKYAAP